MHNNILFFRISPGDFLNSQQLLASYSNDVPKYKLLFNLTSLSYYLYKFVHQSFLTYRIS